MKGKYAAVRAKQGRDLAPSVSETEPDRVSWQMGVAAGLLLAYAVLVLAHARPPSLTDLGQWTYAGVLFGLHLRGRPDPAHTLRPFPVPNSAITVGIGLLTLVLPWALACKAWLLGYFGLVFATMRSVLRGRPGSQWLWLIAPGTLFLSVNFWYGFLNFQMGVCLALLLVARVLRGARREWPYGALLLLSFFAHMIPFGFAAVVLLFYAVRTRRTRLLWQFVPVALATAAYGYGRFFLQHNIDEGVGMITPVRSLTEAFWEYKVNSLLKSGGLVNPGGPSSSMALFLLGRPAFSLMLLADALVCGCILWMATQQMRRTLPQQDGTEKVVWWAILLFLPFYLLLPGEALGVSDPGSRVLQMLLATALLLCGGQGRVLRFASVPAVLLAAMGLWMFYDVGYRVVPQTLTGLPRNALGLAHVANHVQDNFYQALDDTEMNFLVFPTGIFLNTRAAYSIAEPRPAGR